MESGGYICIIIRIIENAVLVDNNLFKKTNIKTFANERLTDQQLTR